MKRNLFTVFVMFSFGLLITSTTAFAVDPPCTSYAGMVDLDKDGYCVFVGAATAASTGFTGEVDCDDTHKSVNPGAREVLGNTTDEDCDGVARVLPMKDSEFALFVKNEYGGNKTLDHTLFLVEFDACTAGAAAIPRTCSVDLVLGKFVPVEGYLFVDAFVNGTEIYRNHGEASDGREVVSKAQYSHYRPCVKTSRPSLTRKTVTVIATTQANLAVGGEATLRQVGDMILQGQINGINAANAGRDSAVNLLGGRVNGLNTDLDQEVADRKDADTAERVDRQNADTLLNGRVTVNESRSVLVEGGASGMVIGRRSLQQVDQSGNPNGEMVRNTALSAGGFGLRIGLETSSGEVAAFGNVGFGADGEGSGADTAYQIGLEALAGSSTTLIGGFATFQSTTDHANSVDASVLDNGVLVGLSLNRDFMPGSGRITGYGRLGVGYSWYATKGMNESGVIIVPGGGVTGLLQLGVNFGAGASN
ncbi:MAG: hypothetical protein UT30_C0001G0079 [Candidatus Uhrbacteria bacterium GW2011_GWF2_39_13]|uniref:Uncharacterized protein n=1 Tax=Candidatus Uhrbacteria bacterium GW2011_GWF2_39_13 TaxID=1618995 RepID=A0A0G0Q3Z5_9BACT|nr:MAG: hypothetical protein UT30_C0001G0079 [Candidatus Uhrbacteria bacterium GW2011_GWF2_39_13]HAU66406.1 hypothetical protein [Candidatus Uhrbacteria bacterium]